MLGQPKAMHPMEARSGAARTHISTEILSSASGNQGAKSVWGAAMRCLYKMPPEEASSGRWYCSSEHADVRA